MAVSNRFPARAAERAAISVPAGLARARRGCYAILLTALAALPQLACQREPARPAPDQAFLAAFVERQKLRSESRSRQAPPINANLLLISVDTTRADHLGCYGATHGASPTIDNLAAESQLFENAYTVMPTTLPSHSAMFTSLYPAQLGVIHNHDLLPDAALTLAERLRGAGFSTAAFVSALPLRADSGVNQGFDTYETPDGPEAPGELAVSRAERWLAARDGERFFAFVHLFDPHTWYAAPEADRALFDVRSESLPPEREWVKNRGWFTPDRIDETRRAYQAEIHYADALVARLLAALRSSGAADTTIVVLLSDHGETLDEALGEYDYAFDHGEFLYRRELRIPLIVRLPQAFALPPGRHAEPVSTLDLMPTLLELLGLPARPPLNGQSLLGLMQGGLYVPERIVAQRRTFRESDNAPLSGAAYAVIDANWHWICADDRPDALFAISDEAQAENVIATQRSVATDFETHLRRWRSVFGYPMWQRGTNRVDPALRTGLESLGYLGGED